MKEVYLNIKLRESLACCGKLMPEGGVDSSMTQNAASRVTHST